MNRAKVIIRNSLNLLSGVYGLLRTIKSDSETSRDLISRVFDNQTINLNESNLLVRMRWGGWIDVDPENIDQLVGLVVNRVWEPATTSLILRNVKKSSTNLNIGTSYGYYAALFGVMGGPNSVNYCVEANPYMIPYLLKTSFWSGTINQTRIMNRAVSNVDGEKVKIYYMPQFSGGGGVNATAAKMEKFTYSSIEETRWSAENLKLLETSEGFLAPGTALYLESEIETITVDSIIPENLCIGIMKVDIEGMESKCVLGAKKVIQRSPDILVILEHSEYTYRVGSDSTKQEIEEAWKFLADEGFRCFQIVPQERYDLPAQLLEIFSFEEWKTVPHGDFAFSRIVLS